MRLKVGGIYGNGKGEIIKIIEKVDSHHPFIGCNGKAYDDGMIDWNPSEDDLLNEITDKRQEALMEMLHKYRDRTITEWTFRMFVEGFLSNL